MNRVSDTVTLIYFHSVQDMVAGNMLPVVKARINAEGRFLISFDLKTTTRFFLSNDTLRLASQAYLSPGDSLFLDVGKDSIDAKGRGSDKINFIVAFNDSFFDGRPKKEVLANAFTNLDMQHFLLFRDKMRRNELSFLNECYQNKKADKDFRDVMIAEINYQFALDKLQYLWRHDTSGSHKNIPHDASYFKMSDDIPLESRTAISSPAYWLYLREFISTLWFDKFEHLNSNDRKAFNRKQYATKFRMVDSLLHQPYNDMEKGELICEKLKSLQWKPFSRKTIKTEADSLLQVWRNTKPDTDMYNYVMRTYDKEFSILNKSAADFILTSSEGTSIKLSDYKGKVILLDFWQTTCSSCLKEIPYANKLEDKMKAKDFVMLDICFGTNRNDWHKILQKKGWHGIHLYSEDMNMFHDNYNLEYVFPQYVLIDKEGKIVTTNARMPSNEVDKDIEKLMESK